MHYIYIFSIETRKSRARVLVKKSRDEAQSQRCRARVQGDRLPAPSQRKTNIDATSQIYICLITHFPTFGSTESVIEYTHLESTRFSLFATDGSDSVGSTPYNKTGDWSCAEKPSNPEEKHTARNVIFLSHHKSVSAGDSSISPRQRQLVGAVREKKRKRRQSTSRQATATTSTATVTHD